MAQQDSYLHIRPVEGALRYGRKELINLTEVRLILNLDTFNPVLPTIAIFKVNFMVYVRYSLAYLVYDRQKAGISKIILIRTRHGARLDSYHLGMSRSV